MNTLPLEAKSSTFSWEKPSDYVWHSSLTLAEFVCTFPTTLYNLQLVSQLKTFIRRALVIYYTDKHISCGFYERTWSNKLNVKQMTWVLYRQKRKEVYISCSFMTIICANYSLNMSYCPIIVRFHRQMLTFRVLLVAFDDITVIYHQNDER